MKRITKRIFSITLCMLLLISLLPVGALATETDAQRILTDAYALEQGESLPYEATLTGEIISIKTPYDSYWQNLTVVMEIAGFEDMPIMCYRLSGEGAECLAMGDIITVTGTITNYYGTIEFAQGCTLDAAVTGTQTLYCQAPENWTQCYIYWWGSNVENPSWPGVAMTQDENGIWGCDLPSDTPNVIFHNDYGVQSGDLYLPVYEDVMYVFEMNEWTTYGKVPVVYDYYVAGTSELCGVDWDAGFYDNKMTAAGDGTYFKIYVGVAAGSYDLKVTIGSWEQSWGSGDEGINNHTVTVEQDNSTVTIYFDSKTGKVSSTVVPAPVPGTQTYYLAGDINGEYYGYGDDADNMGIYRFENGQLTVCFEQDSYVLLKTEGNERWLGSEYYCGLSTGTFSEEWTEWMWIPGQVEVTLTLTENPDGSVTMGYEWPSEAAIIDVAYRLDESTMLSQVFTLTGDIISIDTPYSDMYDNITVTIAVPGSEDQPIQCFRVRGEGAQTLEVGDRIRVTGNLCNYKGTIQFEQGCTLERVIHPGSCPIPMPQPQQIVDEAYELEPGTKLPYIAILTGEIIEIVTPYDKNYKNITVTMIVEGRENKPLVCYRMRGDGVETLKVGDIITVEGVLQNYAKIDSETGEILDTTVEFNVPQLTDVQPIGSTKFYCYAPESWTQCYVYSWSDKGDALSGNWPGTKMTQEYGSLWSCKVPDNADCLIFNNGNGGTNDHTGDLEIPADNKTIYVVQDGQWRGLDYLDPNDDGWGPQSLAIVGEGIPGVPEWYPENPAGDMIQVADNVYTKTLTLPAGTSMNFKFVGNDCWDDNWCFGGAVIEPNRWIELECSGGSANMYLFVEQDCTVRFTVDLNGMKDDGNAALLVERLSHFPVIRRTLTVITPASWTNAYIYAIGEEAFGPLPGEALPKNNRVCQRTITDIEAPVTFVTVDAYGNYTVSEDITLENNGKNVIVILRDDHDCEVIYEDNNEQWGPRSLAIVGEGIPGVETWNPADDAGDLAQIGSNSNVYETILDVPAGTVMGFKITGNDIWDDNWNFGNANIVLGQEIPMECGAFTDMMQLTVLQDSKLRFTVDLNPMRFGDQATLMVEQLPTAPVSTRKLTVRTPASWFKAYLYTWGPELFGTYPGAGLSKLGNDYAAEIAGDLANLAISGRLTDGTLQKSTDIFLEDNGLDVFVIVHEDLSTEVIYQTEPVPPPVRHRKLTVYAPDNWTTANAYTWDPYELGDFPGAALQKNDDAYEMQIPETMVNLVISGSRPDGTRMQTGNIYLESNGRDVTVVVYEDGHYTVSYGIHDISRYRVVGNSFWMGNWDSASNAGLMSEVAPGKFKKTFTDVQPGSYEFKITKDGKWDEAFGNSDGSNFCFTVGVTCDVTVTYTLEQGKVEIFIGNVSVLKGDVTGDGNLNLGDAAKLYGHIRGSLVLADVTILNNADFTDDGNLNIGDVAGLYAYIRGTDKRAIVDAAYRLEENREMEMDYTLTGKVIEVVSPYDSVINCITVRMVVEGRENHPLLCTRLIGDGDDVELITVGDRITVTGRIRNFYGIVEFKEGCRLIDWLDIETEEEHMARIVDQAYALGCNESMDHPVTLTGSVISVENPYTVGVPYISVTLEVQGKEDKPISCYRLMGEGIEYVGLYDTLTVTGTLRNYNGIVEFREGCQLEDYIWYI